MGLERMTSIGKKFTRMHTLQTKIQALNLIQVHYVQTINSSHKLIMIASLILTYQVILLDNFSIMIINHVTTNTLDPFTYGK